MGNREIKFRIWNNNGRCMHEWRELVEKNKIHLLADQQYAYPVMQYTGLKDANGIGLTELYEGDILSENGVIVGSIYEVQQRETDLVIPCIRSKDWLSAYQEAVARGFDYAK